MGNIPPLINCTSGSSCASQPIKHTIPKRHLSFGYNIKLIRLSHFRQMLSKEECFYVLSTLLQQYYSLYKQYNKVVVSDQLCHVSELGEVKVDFCIDGPETPLSLYNQVTHSFVTAVSHILQIVGGLAQGRSGVNSREYSYFHQRIIKIIYHLYSKEDEMYLELLHEVNSYMETHRIKCNLISSLLRLSKAQSSQTQSPLHQFSTHGATPYLGFSRSRSHSQLLNPVEFRQSIIYSNVQRDDRSTIYKIKDNSTKVDSHEGLNHLSRQRKSRNSTYRHKMVRTEGENFYNFMNTSYQNQNSYHHERYLSQAPPTTERPLSKEESQQCSKNNHISAQYSINIHSAFVKQKEGKVSQKVKFKREQISSSAKQNDSEQRDNRKKTSIQQLRSGKPRTELNSNIYTKSVLNDLARSVEVQEEPSSRSYIF